MRTLRVTPVFIALFLAAACGGPSDPTATARTEGAAAPAADTRAGAPPVEISLPRQPIGMVSLSARLDCLGKSGGVLLIGHRGGPTRDYPENAIETFQRTFKAGTKAMEIDIAETKDGKLVLMHDDDLARTTTGVGLVAERTLDEIGKLKLETYSKQTDFHPPTLEAALAWAVEAGAVFELDKKKSASWDPVIAAVRAAKAENNVFLITYSDQQAIDLHRKAPDLVITAEVASVAQLDDLLSKGVKADHLVAWTGTDTPNPALWKQLAARGIESAFGTLGPRATSLDDKFFGDGDGSEFNQLVADGLPILVTDMTDKVSRQVADLRARAAGCGF